MIVSWNALAAVSFWWSTPTVTEAESEASSESHPTRELEMCSIDELEWAEMIEDAFESYLSMDIEKFETKRDEVYEYVHCLSSIVTARTVGDFHKMEVLYSFMDKDKASFALMFELQSWRIRRRHCQLLDWSTMGIQSCNGMRWLRRKRLRFESGCRFLIWDIRYLLMVLQQLDTPVISVYISARCRRCG